MQQVRHTKASARRCLAIRKPLLLKQAHSQAAALKKQSDQLPGDVVLKHQLKCARQHERKQLRLWQTAKLKRKLHDETHCKEPVALKCRGKWTSDRSEWISELQDHCISKYSLPHVSPVVFEMEHQFWKSVKNAVTLDGRKPPVWPFSLTLAKKARLRKGASSGGEDHVVNEAIL